MKKVVVIGGGIAGLATALQIRDRGAERSEQLSVTVLDSAPRLGGNIRTDRIDGFTLEWGPNGYLDNVPAMRRLVERIGLTAEIQQADETASKRFLFRNNRLHLLPSGPMGFVASPVLSLPGRLRVFLEPFARKRPEGIDETIHDFASRRIGPEAAEVLIDAMVSGVFAGDTRNLSLASAFPKMAAMEQAHGSLVRAMVARMLERRKARRKAAELAASGENVEEMTRPGGPAGPGGTLTSFKSGLERLVQGLEAALGDPIVLNDAQRILHRVAGNGEASWRVVAKSGETRDADAVVVAIPASKAGPLLGSVDTTLGREAASVPAAGLAVVALGFDEESIGGSPNGFGFLIPRSQGLRSLGCLWDSSIFPGRAPEGSVLLRVMIGGAHDPDALELADDELLEIVRKDLVTTMRLTAEPTLTRIYRHPRGIAQYEQGHQARMDRIEQLLAGHPGLWVTGSSYYGISMNACVEAAERHAEAVVDYLATR